MRRGANIAFEEHAFGSDPYQTLALCRAPRPDGRVFVVWHGGGWTSGYKEWMLFMAPAFTQAGVTFVSAGYRLAPQHLFPHGVDDAIAALRWVGEHIERVGGDPNKVFIGGHSAGGHHAALINVTPDHHSIAGVPPIRGCLPLSGVYDFTATSGLTVRPRFLGPEGSQIEIAASPLHALNLAHAKGPPMAPMLITYGSDDFPHLRTQAETFSQVARVTGASIETLVLEGRTHFSVSYAGGEADGPWVPRALEFMQRMAA